ncbi:hypothetical protein IGB42_02635 [Andreprevotia sp. IGB-42]|uniref:hypothetical protein n=1 Tax=Andreprevotia sp. IGB-42 TaxID=2497473 RepID=UPI001357C1BF|nr:hypothetical protein [Andreprevotia sp. IGB-42]KAF0812792.1 hypothetical protein IGB42_02635 [Andreprevotia sp. IGB-42]
MINDRLDTLQLALAFAMPAYLVTRKWKDPSLRNATELTQGVLTIALQGGGDYANYPGRVAELGSIDLLLVGSLQVDANNGDIEAAELAMVNAVQDFMHTLPAGLGDIVLNGWRISGQIESPHGWVVFRLTWPFL